MARVQYSNIVNEITGSVGGLTFHRNTSGPLIKLKPLAKRKGVLSVNPVLVDLSLLAGIWNALSLSNRVLWNNYALTYTFYNRYGAVKVLTGYNLFVGVNSVRQMLAKPIISIPGAYVMPAMPINPALSITHASILLSFDSTPIDGDTYFIVFASPPNRLSFSKQRNQLRYCGSFLPAGAINFDMTVSYETLYDITWPLAADDESFKITVAVCAVNEPSGIQSIYSFATSSNQF